MFGFGTTVDGDSYAGRRTSVPLTHRDGRAGSGDAVVGGYQMSMCSEVSEALDAVGLRAPVALTHRVPDVVALLQRFRPGDHGYVDEQVVASGVRGDEPEPAVAVVTCDDALARACGRAP